MRGSKCRNVVGRYIRVLDLSRRGERDSFFSSVSWVRIMDQTACIILSFLSLFLFLPVRAGGLQRVLMVLLYDMHMFKVDVDDIPMPSGIDLFRRVRSLTGSA